MESNHVMSEAHVLGAYKVSFKFGGYKVIKLVREVLKWLKHSL